MRRLLILLALIVALILPMPVQADGYVLPGYLHDQADYGISHHLKPSGCPNINAATYLQQIAAGRRGGPVTPDDSTWLNDLARNIQDQLAGLSATYPDVVFGAYCV